MDRIVKWIYMYQYLSEDYKEIDIYEENEVVKDMKIMMKMK